MEFDVKSVVVPPKYQSLAEFEPTYLVSNAYLRDLLQRAYNIGSNHALNQKYNDMQQLWDLLSK